MLFTLTSDELVRALSAVVHHDDGRVTLDLPASRLQEVAQTPARPPLVFDEGTLAVQYGKTSCRLSPTQFIMLQHISKRGKAGFEELQDVAWGGKRASDGAIRAAVSKLNARLMDSGIQTEVIAHRGRLWIQHAE